MSESTYWDQVRHLVQSGHEDRRPKHEIQEAIVHLVHAAHADGEMWAGDVLTRWNAAGAGDDYTRIYKDLNTTTYIRADGRRVRKTVAYSREMRSAASGEIVGRQMQAWWSMSRAAVAELRNDMSRQSDQIAVVVEALDRLIAAMDRHPECSTAREAWEADGHDIGEIDLGEAAA